HLDLAGCVDHHHGAWGRFHHLTKPLLHTLARGDVDDGREYHAPLVRLDRVEADLDRELAAVLSLRIQVASGAHRPRLGGGEERGAQPWMVRRKRSATNSSIGLPRSSCRP